MRPTGGKQDVAASGEPFEARVAIDLENAAESFEVSSRTFRLAVGAVEVDGRWRVGTGPSPIVARIDP